MHHVGGTLIFFPVMHGDERALSLH